MKRFTGLLVALFVAVVLSGCVSAGTSAEQKYLDQTAKISSELSKSMGRDAELMTGNPDPTDPDWIAAVSRETATWQRLYREAQAISPPARFVDFHARFMDMMTLVDGAAKDISRSIPTLDVDLMRSATDKIHRANAIAAELQTMLDAMD